jgi:hypothetical protein
MKIRDKMKFPPFCQGVAVNLDEGEIVERALQSTELRARGLSKSKGSYGVHGVQKG